MFNIASAPARQSVGETISTLSSRLASSTLLEDRRAAILGLRSFAKDYPASVASDSLRELIASLSKDGEGWYFVIFFGNTSSRASLKDLSC